MKKFHESKLCPYQLKPRNVGSSSVQFHNLTVWDRLFPRFVRKWRDSQVGSPFFSQKFSWVNWACFTPIISGVMDPYKPTGHHQEDITLWVQGSRTQPFATLTEQGGRSKICWNPSFFVSFFWGSYLQDHVFVTTISFLSHLRVSLVYLHDYFLLGKYNMPTPRLGIYYNP